MPSPLRLTVGFALVSLACCAIAVSAAESRPDLQGSVTAIIEQSRQLQDAPFSEVVFAATGKRILPFDTAKPVERELLLKISGALDDLSRRVSAVEAEVFGSTSDDPRSESDAR